MPAASMASWVPTTNAREEIDVHVRIIDASGEVVTTSILNTLIGPKPSRS